MNPTWDMDAEYDAKLLANATSSERLGECLDPLLDGYEAWILSAFDERKSQFTQF